MSTYLGDQRRMVALPLGGLGAGNVALAATGALRQWQLHNTGNHLGYLPQSFFALRLSSVEPPRSYRRLLQSPPVLPHPEPAPLVNDDLDTAGPWTGPQAWSRVRDTAFTGEYPFARVEYKDDWPLEVTLEAYTPFVPLDIDASSLPLAAFTFTIANRYTHTLHGWLLGTLQNAVGWDGVTPIQEARCALFGGNVNRAAAVAGGTAVLMGNDALHEKHPGAGSMALWTPDPAVVLPQFSNADTALATVDALKLLGPVVQDDWSDAAVRRAIDALHPATRWPTGPSPAGTTWAGGLALPLRIEPGASVSVQVAVAWHFPNRYADFDRFGDSDDSNFVAPLIGNHYAVRFADAEAVVQHYASHRDDLLAAGRTWRDALYGSSLPTEVVETLAAQPAYVRSPTTFRAADGRFYGFEGVLGESTLNWNGNVGGSCPLNCSHVWNYVQAVSRLFPELERSMRETDWAVQAPEGYLPHRVLLPLDGPQLHGRPIGGPTRPALDGMLGTILKTYREVRLGAGPNWLERYLPNARRLVDYVIRTWDPAQTGLLTGDQPVTHDISLHGPNMFVGGLWLAALRAMEDMSVYLGDDNGAVEYEQRYSLSRQAYDEHLWNGEYYGQPATGERFDFGAGCLADQLFGQWWAHQLDLGHLLPVEHVRTALRSIVTYNLRHGYREFHHGYRAFADGDDSGLLNCTWPRGGRPAVPIRYADEVWTGVEYEVAGLCMYEGLVDEGLAVLRAVRGRYDGRRRNPYNEIECGDHYSRAMAGWTVLEAYTGSAYNAATGHLRLGLGAKNYPVLAVTGWGQVDTSDRARLNLRCLGGVIRVAQVWVGEATVHDIAINGVASELAGTVELVTGDVLTVIAGHIDRPIPGEVGLPCDS